MVLLTWKAMLRTRNFLGAELLQNLSVIIDEFWAILIWLFICCKTKLKKKFFFLKKYLFFTKYTLFAEKNNFIWKKNFILIFFLLKNFFYRKWKNTCLIWEISIYPEPIYSFCKKIFFDHLVLKVSEAHNMWYSLN